MPLTNPRKSAGLAQTSWVFPHTKEGPAVSEHYQLSGILGKGAFGIVYEAEHRATGEKRACKCIAKAKLVGEEDLEDVRREVQVLQMVGKHENVAELLGVYEDQRNVYLVLELCLGGELFDRIVSKGTFSEKMAAEYFRTMVLVVNHLHQLGVMHRDIKPENFLLSTPDDKASLKLADFGLSTYFSHSQKFTQVVGSAYYVAPEVLRRSYSHEADMWSLGVILYILLSGLPPFWGDTEEAIFKMVAKSEVDLTSAPWPNVSPAAKECVRSLLNRDPARRPTAKQILHCNWLQQQHLPDKPIDSVVITRMRHFAAMNKFKKAALLAVAKSLSPHEINGLERLFKSIDADSSGTITVDELKTALKRMGSDVQDVELRAVMAAADADGNGLIDYDEFIASTVNLNKLEREQALLEAFRSFDLNHDGVITEAEVAEGLKKWGGCSPGDIKGMLGLYDTNKDGVIDWEEFLAMMHAKDGSLKQAASFFRELRVPDRVIASLEYGTVI